MLAGLRRRHCRVAVQVVGEANRDGVDIVACEQLEVVTVHVRRPVPLCELTRPLEVGVGDGDELDAVGRKRPGPSGMARRDPAAADDPVAEPAFW